MTARTFQTVAIRRDWELRIPAYGSPMDMGELQQIVRDSGSHFFDADTMRFFRSRADDYVYPGPDGWYFITSEKHVAYTSSRTLNEPRKYTVRRMAINETATAIRLDEFEAFQHFSTLTRARTAARTLSHTGTDQCSVCHYHLVAKGDVTPCANCQRTGRKE